MPSSHPSLICWADRCFYRRGLPLECFGTLHHYLMCRIHVMPSPHTSTIWRLLYVERTCFAHKNLITLRSLRDQVSGVVRRTSTYLLNSIPLTDLRHLLHFTLHVHVPFMYEACPEIKDTKVLNMYNIFNLQKRHRE